VFVYELTEPLDDFDALTPLTDWITTEPRKGTHWALQAVLALGCAATQVRWDCDMRHLPSVGAVLIPPEAVPYRVVKQDDTGTTFVIIGSELPWTPTSSRRARRSVRDGSARPHIPPAATSRRSGT
jgi:hypothetical protein